MKTTLLGAAGFCALVTATTPAFAFDPIISMVGQVPVIHPGGGTMEVLATKEQSGGAFGVITGRDQPGTGPGKIIQGKNVEMWYVLEGTYEFTFGDKTYEGGPGSFVATDAGQPHEFKAKTPGKLLMIYTPGGFEHFFMDWEKQGLAFGPDLGKLEASYGVTRP